MCGIAGFAGQFSETLLTKMGQVIAHRGPDDAGQVYLANRDHKIGLAHRRLSIIDLSTDGHQPMTVNCPHCQATGGKLWLIYNGEIYNYRELRHELIQKGHHFSNETDSEVLLHLYAEEGVAMLERLNGIFAFAIYDGRTNGQKDFIQPGDILLARDGVGVKPLYYAMTPDGCLFSSELKALLQASELSRQLDEQALHYYLAYLWCPGEKTALRAVKKVLPGQAMIIRNASLVKQWFFYDLPYNGIYSNLTESEITNHLDGLLKQAVSRQMMADVPVGAFLSGGLDSSAIVAFANKLRSGRALDCFSIAFKQGMDSEGMAEDLPYAKSVANYLGVKLHVLEVEANIIDHLPAMIYHLDEPQADLAAIHVMLISQAARQAGIKVLLSGAGGDDIFSGYRRHQALHIDQFWKWMPMPCRQAFASLARNYVDGATKKHFLDMQSPSIRRMAKLCLGADLPNDRRLTNHFMWNTERLRRSVYSKEMAAAVSNLETASPLLQSLQRIPDENDALNRMLYLEGKHFLPDHNLNYNDKMSMAAGVEVRVPLLDPDLIQFATKISPRLKQKGKVGKAIFKKTMEPYLPHNIIYRPKTGFGAPLRRWLHHELKEMVNEVLSVSALAQRNIFDAKAVHQLIKMDKLGQVDAAYSIFSILCIELWCKRFVDSGLSV